jgi:hypothetical protein
VECLLLFLTLCLFLMEILVSNIALICHNASFSPNSSDGTATEEASVGFDTFSTSFYKRISCALLILHKDTLGPQQTCIMKPQHSILTSPIIEYKCNHPKNIPYHSDIRPSTQQWTSKCIQGSKLGMSSNEGSNNTSMSTINNNDTGCCSFQAQERVLNTSTNEGSVCKNVWIVLAFKFFF